MRLIGRKKGYDALIVCVKTPTTGKQAMTKCFEWKETIVFFLNSSAHTCTSIHPNTNGRIDIKPPSHPAL